MTIEIPGAVTDIVSGLKQQPVLLALVVLNLIAAISAVWFLRELVSASRSEKQQILTLLERCIKP